MTISAKNHRIEFLTEVWKAISYCILVSTILCTACRAPQQATVDTTHNSSNSLDREGVYTGTLPCADCAGIQTVLYLHGDKSFVLQYQYKDQSDTVFTSKGTFTWSEKGGKITLNHQGNYAGSVQYVVGENFISQTDMAGNRITGKLEEQYRLQKIVPSLTATYWKLTMLYGKPVVLSGKASPKEAYLLFKAEENRVTGYGGCNTFSGHYIITDGNRIRFEKMISTMMACPEQPDTESLLMQVLNTADNFVLSGNILTLNKARMAPLARFEAVYLR